MTRARGCLTQLQSSTKRRAAQGAVPFAPPRHSRMRHNAATCLLAGLAAAMLGAAVAASAEESGAALPEPLTLAQALGLASGHPRTTAKADAELPPRPQPLYMACHTLAFNVASSGDERRDLAWGPLLSPLAAQQLEIMQRFYDVQLADLSYMRDNEAMAVGYIQFDRAEARRALGQYSPLAVAELEAAYQLIRRQRAASDAARRITRSMLAQALGSPNNLPKTLLAPPPPPPDAPLPALEDVVATALADNPHLTELSAGADPARAALVAMSVRQQALELLERLELLAVAAEQTRMESDWRDLKLDQSRTMYEMEVTADLGYSMSRQTKAHRDETAVALCRALTLAQLDALQGKPLTDTNQGATNAPTTP